MCDKSRLYIAKMTHILDILIVYLKCKPIHFLLYLQISLKYCWNSKQLYIELYFIYIITNSQKKLLFCSLAHDACYCIIVIYSLYI